MLPIFIVNFVALITAHSMVIERLRDSYRSVYTEIEEPTHFYTWRNLYFMAIFILFRGFRKHKFDNRTLLLCNIAFASSVSWLSICLGFLIFTGIYE